MDSLTIGKLYLRQGDFKTARTYFEKVIHQSTLSNQKLSDDAKINTNHISDTNSNIVNNINNIENTSTSADTNTNFNASNNFNTKHNTNININTNDSKIYSNEEILEANLYLGRIAIESQDQFLLKVLLANVQAASTNNKMILVYQRYLTGLSYFYEGHYRDAFQIFRECKELAYEFDLPRFQIISLILQIKTHLYLDENQTWLLTALAELEYLMSRTQAVELWTHYYITLASVELWKQSYESAEKWAICALEKNKQEQDYFLFIAILILIAEVHIQQNKFELATNGLKIARSLLNPEVMKRMYLKVESLEQQIINCEKPHFILFEQDLKIKYADSILDLGRQFVIKDLLVLFLKNPGLEFSKEEIVQKIWKQDYNPEVHDNLIYVTIRRLRHILRKESQNQIIQKSKQGYQLNPKITIEVR